jgi:hypothetical protein
MWRDGFDSDRVMPRLLAAVCVLLTAGCWIASGEAGDRVHNTVTAAPTQLDYLVLASMAYAPRPLAMASYRPEPARAQASEVAVQLH